MLFRSPVFMYLDEGRDHEMFYQQSALAAQYFNEAKIMIENNRNGMIEWFKANGYTHLMKRTPQKQKTIYQGRIANSYGYYRGEEEKEADVIRVNAFVNNKCASLFFRPLIKGLMTYQPDVNKKKNDETDAFSACLFHLTVTTPNAGRNNTASVFSLPRVSQPSKDNHIASSRDLRQYIG